LYQEKTLRLEFIQRTNRKLIARNGTLSVGGSPAVSRAVLRKWDIGEWC
jgi:hypothetical protein